MRLARDGASVAIPYASSPQKAQQVVDTIVKEGGTALALEADS
jgi:3-oxoacyl-[acyl-carrier protein] reductase